MIRIHLPEGMQINMKFIQRIDNEHCNPKQMWKDMGSPAYLKADQIQQLLEASDLKRMPLDSLEVLVPAQGICAIDIEF
jgi:xylan 1,4-beta-xylosidase